MRTARTVPSFDARFSQRAACDLATQAARLADRQR
jgi:hypothetical protein